MTADLRDDRQVPLARRESLTVVFKAIGARRRTWSRSHDPDAQTPSNTESAPIAPPRSSMAELARTIPKILTPIIFTVFLGMPALIGAFAAIVAMLLGPAIWIGEHYALPMGPWMTGYAVILLGIAVLLWAVNGRPANAGDINRDSLLHDICPACAGPLPTTSCETDGCTVCPQCKAAWRITTPQLLLLCARCRANVSDQPLQDGTIKCGTCGLVHRVGTA